MPSANHRVLVPLSRLVGRLLLPRTMLEARQESEERRQAQEALLEAKAELARVARVLSMGELTASIAHEVNQPLAAVVTNAEASLRWLAADPPNVRKARESVERIIRDARLASDVIARIRTFLKRGEAKRAPVQLHEVIAEVVKLVQAEVRDQDVAVQVRSATDLPPVSADRVQLQQVILNLVLNAIEAMTGSEGVHVVEIVTDKYASNAVFVSVRDSGHGLDAAHMERLFEPFFTTKRQGMGMGLAISRSIVEAHGGRLWATRNPGDGATFQFVLPQATQDSQSSRGTE